ncbi:MAG: tetratricopeptide repeat protein [Candidatus Brocadiia bacterium]
MRRKIILALGLIALISTNIILSSADDAELAGAVYQSGLNAFKQNKFDDAAQKFARALEYKSDYTEAMFKLAECHEKLRNSQQAVRYYRQSARQVASKTDSSTEERNILQQSRKVLEKLDVRGTQFNTAKSKQIDILLKMANDCAGRKYFGFARRIYEQILIIDPGNKTAADAMEKLAAGQPVESPDSKTAGKAKSVFNGKNLDGWQFDSNIWLNLWSIEEGCLAFNKKPLSPKAGPSLEPSALKLAGQLPDNYVMSMEMFIEKRLPSARECCISFLYGESKIPQGQANIITMQRAKINFEKTGIWEKIKFTKKGNEYAIEGANTKKFNGVFEPYNTQCIGFYIHGFVVKIRNITVKETQ